MEMREEIRRVTCPHLSQYEGEIKGKREESRRMSRENHQRERERDNFI